MGQASGVTKMQMNKKGYRDLRVYHEAHALVLEVYAVTDKYPKSEIFGLVSQMRRAAVSVVANIIEGHARFSKKEFRQFLFLANGSLVELEYYIELSLALKYISMEEYEKLDSRRNIVGSLLGGFIRSINRKLTP